MSQESVQIVRTAFERWGTPALFDSLAPDIEWEVRPDLPDASIYRGHDDVRRLISRFREVLSDIWFAPEEFIEARRSATRREAFEAAGVA